MRFGTWGAKLIAVAVGTVLLGLSRAAIARQPDDPDPPPEVFPSMVDAGGETPADVSSAPDVKVGGVWNYVVPSIDISSPPNIDFTIPHAVGDLTPNGYGNYHPIRVSSQSAGIGVATDFHTSRASGGTSLLLKFNLNTHHFDGAWNDPNGTDHVVDVSLDGKLAVLLGDSEVKGSAPNQKDDHIQVVDISVNPPKILVSTVPYIQEDKGKRHISFVALVDDEHLLTKDNDHRIVLWKLPEMTPIYSHRLDAPSVFWDGLNLSPDRKYFVTEEDDPRSFRFSSQISLFNALTGAGCGGVPFFVPGDAWNADGLDNSFSPDGKLLLHKHSGGITIFALDGPTPRKVLNIGKPMGMGWPTIGSVEFAGPGYLLINDQFLFDIDQQYIVWRYERLDKDRYLEYGNTLVACAQQRIDTGLNNFHFRFKAATEIKAFQLPDAATKAALAKVNKTQYVIKPGDKVTIDVHLSDKAEVNQKIADAFAKQLTDNGMIVADNQPIKLEVGQGSFGVRDVQYRGVTNPTVGGVAHVAASFVNVSFTVNGKVVWENQRLNGGVPQFLTVQPGQSIDQAVAEKQVETPVMDFVLPKQVPPLRDPVGFGVTDLSSLMDAPNVRQAK